MKNGLIVVLTVLILYFVKWFFIFDVDFMVLVFGMLIMHHILDIKDKIEY